MYTEFGDGCIKAKALDDRVGCAILLEILKERYGLIVCMLYRSGGDRIKSAGVAAFRVNPDIAIVVEGTTALMCRSPRT